MEERIEIEWEGEAETTEYEWPYHRGDIFQPERLEVFRDGEFFDWVWRPDEITEEEA